MKNRRLLIMTGAGAVGGVAGFVLSRIAEVPEASSDGTLMVLQGVWFALVIGAIGSAIAYAGFTLDGRRPSTEMILIGLGVLLGSGFVSGVVAQQAFTGLLDSSTLNTCFSNYRRVPSDSELNWCVASAFRFPRLVGWTVAGALGGVGIGAFLRSKRRGVNAALGGLAAGIIGGLLFDVIPAVAGLSVLWPSQFIAVVIIGALIGLLVSVIETLRLNAWVEVLSGELKGRTIALTESVSRIGTERSLEIPVIGDSAVHGFHARILFSGTDASIEPIGGPVDVGGRSAPSPLRNGDVFTVGRTSFRFNSRAAGIDSAVGQSQGARPPAQPTSATPGQPAQPQPSATPGPRQRPRLDLKPPS